jgi:hypothetical protein
MLRRFAGRCPPQGLIRLGVTLVGTVIRVVGGKHAALLASTVVYGHASLG